MDLHHAQLTVGLENVAGLFLKLTNRGEAQVVSGEEELLSRHIFDSVAVRDVFLVAQLELVLGVVGKVVDVKNRRDEVVPLSELEMVQEAKALTAS